ncbi:hypothetical protein LTR42_006626 [Elasticomyces elasticus]|nr:hypothetical protein LTR42_006626 [Elasticomyces elasticus]
MYRFRLVVCQLDVLQDCLDRRSLDKALLDLPRTLAGIYTRIFNNIPDGHREPAIRLLQFLLFADFGEEPWRLDDAVDTIAVEPDERPAFRPEHRIPEPEEVARYCSSLTKLTIGRSRHRNENDTSGSEVVHIQLAHASVNEYLASRLVPVNFKSSLEQILAHEAIVSVCVAYLITAAELSASEHSGNLPFAYFRARHWLSHAREVEANTLESSAWAVALLTSEKSHAYWQLVIHSRPFTYPTDPLQIKDPLPSPLYCASEGGLTETARVLLDEGADANEVGGRCYNALNVASLNGRETIVRLLLDNNAENNWNNQHDYSGYLCDCPNALYIGHTQATRGCALPTASRSRHVEIVQLLLEAGADTNDEDGCSYPLTYACNAGDEVIVRMLIDSGANVNASDGSALQQSSHNGKLASMQILLKHGANVNAQGGNWGNALIAACDRTIKENDNGDEVLPVVRLLLENGAQVNRAIQDRDHPNALYAAARRGHVDVVQLLIEYAANVNAHGGHHGNALNAALTNGHESIAQLLLTREADVHIHGRALSDALTAAAYGGCEAVVRLPLEAGADVNTRKGFKGKRGTPLQAACFSLHSEAMITIVHLLLEWGAEINAKAIGEGLSALQGAVRRHATPVVEMLIERGAYINASDDSEGNALQVAVKEDEEAMVHLLLDRGADINALGGYWNSTALMEAAEPGRTSMVRLLLDEGADPNVQGGFHGNALSSVRQCRDRAQEIRQMLLAARAVDYGPEKDWDSAESETSTPDNQSSTYLGCPREVLERLRKLGLMGQQRKQLGKKRIVVVRVPNTLRREFEFLHQRLRDALDRALALDEAQAIRERWDCYHLERRLKYEPWLLGLKMHKPTSGYTRRRLRYIA